MVRPSISNSALRDVTPSFLRATRSAVTNASRYATPLSTSTRVAIGSSVIGAHRGPAYPSGSSTRDHTSAQGGDALVIPPPPPCL